MWPYTFGHMKRLEKIYLIKWTARPRNEPASRIYIQRDSAQDFFIGLKVGGAVNPSIDSFEIGDKVRLTREANRSMVCPRGRGNARTAKILSLLRDIEGGAFMDRDLRGTRHWNVTDLEKVYK
jgi:hypothetical protein